MVLAGTRKPTQRRAFFADEDDTSSAGPSVTLSTHNRAVAEAAERFARLCGLPQDLCEDIRLAASLHDVGKADMRFQAWLHGGNRRKAESCPDLLAKSIELPRSLAEYLTARRKSRYPESGRHELLSVRLAECGSALPADAGRRELILHLIGAHHGHCRPFAPVIEDPQPEMVEFQTNGDLLRVSSATGLECLDSGVPERFWRLVRRYGWWGLPWIEAIVRLADWHVSEVEMEKRKESTR